MKVGGWVGGTDIWTVGLVGEICRQLDGWMNWRQGYIGGWKKWVNGLMGGRLGGKIG